MKDVQQPRTKSPQPGLQGAKRFSLKKVLADTLQGRIYLAKDRSNNEWTVVKETLKELFMMGKSLDVHRVPEDFENEKKIQTFLSTQKDAHPGKV